MDFRCSPFAETVGTIGADCLLGGPARAIEHKHRCRVEPPMRAQIAPLLDHPYAIFGHREGAAGALEVSLRLAEPGIQTP